MGAGVVEPAGLGCPPFRVGRGAVRVWRDRGGLTLGLRRRRVGVMATTQRPPIRPFLDATGTLRPTPTEILAALAVEREEGDRGEES